MEEKEVLGTKVPLQAIDKFVAPVQRFLKIESTAGIGLIAVTIIALLWANLSNETYLAFRSILRLDRGASIRLFTMRRPSAGL